MTTNSERAKLTVCALLDKVQPPEYSYGPSQGHRKHGSWVVFKNAEAVMSLRDSHEPFASALDEAERRGQGEAVAKAVNLFYLKPEAGDELLRELLAEPKEN